MRPNVLFNLFTDVLSLKGIGPKNKPYLEKLCGPHLIDLLFHLPTHLIDRRYNPGLINTQPGDLITCTVTIEKHLPAASNKYSKTPYRVRCFNETGYIFLSFFNARKDYLEKILPIGEHRVISGRIERYHNETQMPHPDYILQENEQEALQKLEPVYPLTAGLSNKQLQKFIKQTISLTPDLKEWINPSLITEHEWPNWKQAITSIHQPQTKDDITINNPGRTRLAYDELLANQLALALSRDRITKQKGIPHPITPNNPLTNTFYSTLPFTLTQSQQDVINEITKDQQSKHRMLRLLQGDVGSGKTVVALVTMLNIIEQGYQTALMAPTEILARQHYDWITQVTEPLGLKVELLISKLKNTERRTVLENIASGNTHITIGTHALFQDTVTFNKLGYIIIDEQHRFGVKQRLKLANKGDKTDILLMTATPIPRTLTMTTYGDMDISRITEKPKSRKPITTSTIPASRINEVIEGIKRNLEKGEKTYWICPLIEESEALDLAAAEERFQEFQQVFGNKTALIHGRTPAEERENIMQNFKHGAIDILVATTVVEVGVDVKDATAIIIEHAERFGLAQLHQLRGRVGRGDKASSCILLYHSPLSNTAKARLTMMRQTEDGFLIAEEDLSLRGSGDILGTKQSGLPSFRLASLEEHKHLLSLARKDAYLILNQDPKLDSPRGQALKTLLYLFQYDTQIKFIKTG